jgi:hypothetical protein
MALLTPGSFTYAEWALRHDKDGKISTLVNMLSQCNSVIDDMLTVECQSGNAFEFTQVVKLPTPSRRIYNSGVARSQGGVAKLVATCSQYADWATIDKDLAELGGNLAQLRANEVQLHMQGLGQQLASDLFYANRSTDPTAFTGFANIYNTVNPATSPIAKNVLDCLGTGNTNTSLWLINWGPTAIHAIFPKGTQAGLEHRDMGMLPITDGATPAQEFLAYRDWLSWKIGLAIHDWRQAVRACNIDVAALNTGGAANLITILAKMVHRLPVQPSGVGPVNTSDSTPDKIVMGRPVFYANRSILEYLDIQAANKSNVLLQQREWDGMTVTTYRGIPIRCVDALLDTESRVV